MYLPFQPLRKLKLGVYTSRAMFWGVLLRGYVRGAYFRDVRRAHALGAALGPILGCVLGAIPACGMYFAITCCGPLRRPFWYGVNNMFSRGIRVDIPLFIEINRVATPKPTTRSAPRNARLRLWKLSFQGL